MWNHFTGDEHLGVSNFLWELLGYHGKSEPLQPWNIKPQQNFFNNVGAETKVPNFFLKQQQQKAGKKKKRKKRNPRTIELGEKVF